MGELGGAINIGAPILLLAGVVVTGLFSWRNNTDKSLDEREAKELERLTQRVADQDIEMVAMHFRFNVLEDYAHLLRSHIADSKAPPPPEWPTEIYHESK